jgi:hypothetical protein
MDERFREIVSDPLNLLIDRVPEAGFVDERGFVILHNGNRVPASGRMAYCGEFSQILVINRGVHEPLEEFCFQALLNRLRCESPSMLELGAYWAHYSLWMKRRFPSARCTMLEPDARNLRIGKRNFESNGFEGTFLRGFVGTGHFELDREAARGRLDRLDVLHADIQGHEVELLRGGKDFLSEHRAEFAFVSTHSEALHHEVVGILESSGYRVEVSSPFDAHTTSSDGFVLASSPRVEPLFSGFRPMGRLEIARSAPAALVSYLGQLASH